MLCKESKYKGLDSIVIENQSLRLEFIPEYGAKLASFYHKATKREFLFQSDTKKLRLPNYGADFSNYDSSGFDEVFPSIDPSFYPDNIWQGISIPDHGEVWTLPWEMEVKKDSLKFSVYSPCFPYKLEKKVTLVDRTLRINYQAYNLGQQEFKFIWAAHALLNCSQQSTKIILPPEVDEIINVETTSEHLGDWGARCNYPIAESIQGKTIDMSRVEAVSANNCEKFYVANKLTTGKCAVEYSDTQERLTYCFPVDKVPYLAIWKTQGGYRGDYNIALEPCTGAYDDLYLADRINKVAKIPAKGSYKWYLELTIDEGG